MKKMRSIAVLSSYESVGVSTVAELIAKRALDTHWSKVNWVGLPDLRSRPDGPSPDQLRQWTREIITPTGDEEGFVIEIRSNRAGATLQSMRGTYLPRAIDKWLVVCDDGHINRGIEDLNRLLGPLGVEKASMALLVNPVGGQPTEPTGIDEVTSVRIGILVYRLPFMPVLQLRRTGAMYADLFETPNGLCSSLVQREQILGDFRSALEHMDAAAMFLGLSTREPRMRRRR